VGTVVFVVYDRMQLLDLAGPADVFRAASLFPGIGYEVVTASVDGAAVRADNGITVQPDASLARLGRRSIETLLVVGGLGVDAAIADGRLPKLLRSAAPRAERVASVCTGALALAAAGLLDGYRATTHWASCADLAEDHPGVEVVPDCIHVHDRDRWTSAGVTAGIDLALAMVEHDHGPEVAHQIAGWLVVFVRRPGGQAQFSAQLRSQPARTPAIASLQAWLPDHLADDLEVDALAERSAMSARSFARAFRRETGTTPAAYVEGLRVEAARRLLETSDLTVAAVATTVGIRHAETLHRAFRRRVGTTPDQYRQHFRRNSPPCRPSSPSTPASPPSTSSGRTRC
jgi:transcriptional regulator GlxA family with amidase domain